MTVSSHLVQQALRRNLKKRSPAIWRGILVVLCFLPMACGRAGSNLSPVHGEVFFDDTPAVGAVVHFHPVNIKECAPAFGEVDEFGSFRLSTRASNDGAAPGDYLVSINWRKEERVDGELVFGPNRLGERYSKPTTSALKVTIVQGENELKPFEIKKSQDASGT